MTYFTRRLALLFACIGSIGCIADHHLTAEQDRPDTPRTPGPGSTTCDIENPSCADGLICALVDPCGSACPTNSAEEVIACPQVCVEVYACVPTLVVDDLCEPEDDRCGGGLSCTLDDGRCGPSDCHEDGCLECPPVYTCQPSAPPTTCESVRCAPGYICEITVNEGCGYADPFEQGVCEPEELAACVALEDHVIGETCEDTRCRLGYRCTESDVYLPCDGPGCDEPVDVYVACVSDSNHTIGETCEDTTCLDGFECWEHDEVVCQGPGCDEEPGFFVTCEPVPPPVDPGANPSPEPPSNPAEEGESCAPDQGDCVDGLRCAIDEEAGCQPSFCAGGLCTTDCVAVYTCQAE